MNSMPELMQTAKDIIEKNGKASIEKARREILVSQYYGGIVSSALKYFARVTLRSALPVFPALMSLSCEAVGGKKERTASIGAALALIAGAADIHDDIIDRSTIKYDKKTVVGKFGSDIALLAGDALLMQGSMLLHKECESLPSEQSERVLSLILEALFEISKAEAMETLLRRKLDVKPHEYFEVIRLKAVVPEVHCRIGGILGNANEEMVEFWGHYGRTFGIVSGIREEFMDLLDYSELQNRIRSECLPLPMLYAFQNSEIRKEIQPLIGSPNFARKDAKKMVKIIMDFKDAQGLKEEARLYVEEENRKIYVKLRGQLGEEAKLLLKATIEGL